ncbi:RHS repeat-associated core domain-containing protein [Dyella acidisoli]|uniref:RHS repeat-associated core domain-containing protein n=1 Tax=Dyella acidisoli TaxID=1867834 RepID=A0ABQ5XVN3_9GAMM|nr:RHS repeat-associated core domain-containing protein [Dyella acidisoli]GLQ95536.1 hypothetical protein GCM10007901_44920 [Dyella acidisoli]
MAKISNLSKFFSLARAGEKGANAPLNVRTPAAKHTQRRPSRINSKLTIALVGLVAVAGINNQLVSVAHADDAVPTKNNDNDGGGGGGGVGGVTNAPPVNVPGYIPPSVYPTQITLGPGQGYVGPIIEPVGMGPSGGGSIHTPANKAPTSKKNQNSNPCPDNQGDPIMMSTGNKALSVTEFSLPGEMGLKFERFYNSKSYGGELSIGGWQTSIDFHLYGTECSNGGGYRPNCAPVTLLRPDGSTLNFSLVTPVAATSTPVQVTGPFNGAGTALLTYNASNNTYVVQDEDSHVLTFNSSGALLSINDLAGVGWTITHPNSSTTVVTHTSGQSYTIAITGGTDALGDTVQTTVTDPAGNAYVYNTTITVASIVLYSSLGRINSVTYPGSPTTTVSYTYISPSSTLADLLTGVAYNGIAHDVTTYDSSGNANSTSMADGTQNTSIAYSSNSVGRVATVTNALGHVSVYQYNSSGLLVSITGDASAHCTASYASVTYDANGNMSSSTDNNGNVTEYTYASNGLLQQEVENPGASQRVTNFVWDTTPGANRLLSVTVVGYLETSYTYNAQGRLASIAKTNLSSNGVANQAQTTTYSYALSANGLVTSKTITLPSPSNSNTITYSYNSEGFETSETNVLGQSTTYSNFTGRGLPQTVTTENGDVNNYGYNAGRLTTISHTHDGATNTGYVYYDANSRQISEIVLFDNEITTNSYDADFKLLSSKWTGPSGAVITKGYSYDNNGDVTSVSWTRQGVSAADLITHTSYDELGRPIVQSGNHGQSLTTAYDRNGNVASVTDAAGNVTSHKYDAFNRLQSSVDATGRSTSYTYDLGDNTLQVTDPRGLSTTYRPDAFGDLWSINSPDTGTTSYAFDAFGRRTSKTTNDGVTTTYSYDTLNRVTSFSAGGKTITYAYDSCTYGKGYLCSFTDPTGTTSYTYYIEGTLASKSWSDGSLSNSTSYAYDGMNRLLQISEGGIITVNYALIDNQVGSVNLSYYGHSANVVSSVTYDAVRHPIGWTYGNGVQRSQAYDNDGRITSITSTIGSSTVQSLSYAWDSLNRITGITNGAYPVVSQNFTYDSLYRLTGMTGPAPVTLTYDPNGNRTQQDWKTNDAVTISSSSNQMTARGTHSYTYNANGSRATDTVSGVTTTYNYDPFGNLSSAGRPTAISNCETNGTCPTYPAGTTAYVSNALGQRIIEDGPNGFELFNYGIDGQLTGENVVPSSGSSTSNYYVYLNGEPVALVNNENTLYYVHDDHHGRPEEITNSSGSMVWLGLNYAFDRSILVEGIQNVDIGLPGQVYDSNTGNWSNGFRDYDSSNGRFLESDPIGLSGGVNTYAYVGGDPLDNVDPSGLATMVLVGGSTAGNPFGHVALAFTGQGVYSYGTGTAFGSSTTDYLAKQATYRSTTAYVLNTTPEQEQKMIDYLQSNYSPQSGGKYSVLRHDCATAANGALSAAGIGDGIIDGAAQAGGILLPQLPSTSAMIAASYPGASIVQIPQGGSAPSFLGSFNPMVH